jgi:hypothetical protein
LIPILLHPLFRFPSDSWNQAPLSSACISFLLRWF